MALTHPPRSAASPLLDLHIDELALHGFPPQDRDRIAGSLQHELHRLLASGAQDLLPHTSFSLDRLDVGSFSAGISGSPQYIGRQVAQRIYRQLTSPQITPSPHNGFANPQPKQ